MSDKSKIDIENKNTELKNLYESLEWFKDQISELESSKEKISSLE